MQNALLTIIIATFLTACVSYNLPDQKKRSTQQRQSSLNTENAEESFTGNWDAPENGFSSFSLNLTQSKNQIIGYHEAIALRGNRIDAALPTETKPSIVGTIANGIAHIQFKSAYGEDGRGKATITIHGNIIEWKITESYGVHYLPNSAVLTRQKLHDTK